MQVAMKIVWCLTITDPDLISLLLLLRNGAGKEFLGDLEKIWQLSVEESAWPWLFLSGAMKNNFLLKALHEGAILDWTRKIWGMHKECMRDHERKADLNVKDRRPFLHPHAAVVFTRPRLVFFQG